MIFAYKSVDISHFPIGNHSLNLYWLIFFGGILVIRQLLLVSFRTGFFPIIDDRTSTFVNYPKYVSKIVLWAAIGLQIFGRVGYAFLRSKNHSWSNEPFWFFQEMGQGLSPRFALLGALVACWFATRNLRLNYLKLCDLLCFIAPTFLFLVRILEFLSDPVPGLPTNQSFGIIYPDFGDVARHPLRLYQALLEGLFLQFIVYFSRKQLSRPGYITSIFLIGFIAADDIVAFFRDTSLAPEVVLGNVTFRHWTALVTVGIVISIFFKKEKSKAAAH